jgi:hypothetical protein
LTPDKNARLEDQLGPDEPPYRSRGEAQVGRLLDRYGLPFVYEQATLIYDRGRCRVWHPDFKLPQYGGLVVEYAGMMDVPNYAAGIQHKQRVYAANAIPALFIYPRDLMGPAWPAQLAARIRRAGDAALQPRRDSPYRPRCSLYGRAGCSSRYRRT